MRRGAALLAFCALVVVGRVGLDSVSALAQARSLEAAGEHHEAAVRYGSAIRAYLPLSPVGARAGDALLALGARAEAAGEPLEARFCYEELRSGFLATRSLWQPGQRFVAEAERRLVPLMLADRRGNWPDRALPEGERAAVIQGVLAEREDPSNAWVLVMGAGYLIWIGGAGLAIWRGLSEDDDAPVAWKALGQWAAVSAAGYGLWLLGVALA
jgi:hypothetical protein